MMKTILIVGGGHAGGRVAHHLRGMGHEGPILVARDEEYLPYERPPLSKDVLAGTMEPGALALKPVSEWDELGVTFLDPDPVREVDAGAGVAHLASGGRVGFDILVMATGSRNRMLAAAAPHAPVLSLRTLPESLALRAALGGARSIAIVGGGVIGLEVAAAAREMGRAVTVLEAGSRVMGRILSPGAATWLAGVHRDAGAELHFGVNVRMVDGHAGAMRVETDSEAIAADCVLVAIGAHPCTEVLPKAERGQGGGLLCDATCRLRGFEGRAYAVGDVAEAENPLYGRPLRLETWRNAETQARMVAADICGQPRPEPELPWLWTDQHGRNLQVLGLWNDAFTTVMRGAPGEPGAVEFWLEGGVLRGAVLFDAGRERRHLEALIRAGASPDPAALADAATRLKDLARVKIPA